MGARDTAVARTGGAGTVPPETLEPAAMTVMNPVRPVRTAQATHAAHTAHVAHAAVAARAGAPVVRTGLVRLRVSADDAQRRALTPREVEVLSLVAAGRGRDEISRRLGMAPDTVASHMSRIYRALGARNAAHAVALAHGCGVMALRPGPQTPTVSPRERQVLAGLAHGLTSEQVAVHLSLSIETVKTHLRRVYRKLGVTSRANAVETAINHRLLAVVVDTSGAATRRRLVRAAA
ncbi:DNA-binding CsgD family transcriptional regulator [Catenulispora sp. MAP12-49]|uniref:response regulator transcription factor n=1 Tax=Catenulispora sp. MAP12-49 TaxID=3156302 RepID=UPI0035125A62